jgi:hypothetical protein
LLTITSRQTEFRRGARNAIARSPKLHLFGNARHPEDQRMNKLILSIFSLVAAFALPSKAETIVALTSGNRLLFFDSASPGTVTKVFTVTTFTSEPLVALDFRPATGDLYAVAASGRLYVLNLTSGAASIPNASPAALSGTRFGFDFNPTVDRIRVTSDTEQNIRLNPDTGTFAGTDDNLRFAAADVHAGADPNVVGSAYTNNFVGAGATVLYDIDSNVDKLLIQNPPNGGFLNTVGALGVDTTDNVGFDISGGTGIAYASLTVGATTGLYRIDLASGAATLVGAIADATVLAGETVLDLSVPTPTRLLNIAARGRVGLGDDVLIGGFINRGGGRVLLRAIGPSLGAFGVTDFLADPVLTLRDNNGNVLATNDDWQTTQGADITATGLAPTNSAESAILASLPAGNYTGVVSGKGTATGVAVIEIYQLP